MCRSTIALRRAIRTPFAGTRQNWPRSRRMSSFRPAPQPWLAVVQATRTIPVVFVSVVDPVGAGFVDSMAQPGGNATGFVMLEYSMTAK